MSQGSRAESSLGDVLVETPVIEIGDPEAQEQGGPGQHGVIGRQEHVHPRLVQRPEPFNRPGLGRQGLEQDGAGLGIRDGGGFGRRTQCTEGKNHDESAADDQGAALDEVGPGAGLETAGGDVEHGDDPDDQGAHGQADGIPGLGRQGADRQGPGVGDRAQEQHIDEEGGHRHHDARRGIEPHLQKLRHGVNPGPKEVRKEGEADHDEGDGGHPFVAGDGQANMAGGVAAHPDELLRRDVGGDQGKPDQPPAQTASGQKVILAALFATALEQADGDDQSHEGKEDGEIDGGDLEHGKGAHGARVCG